MKNGLMYEHDQLVYYKNDLRCHAGVIEVDGDIYYIGTKGRAVKGRHVVHKEMCNGILKRGTYTFGDDYKLVKGSYERPKKNRVSTKSTKIKKPGRFAKLSKQWSREELIGLSAAAIFLVCLIGTALVVDYMQNRPGQGEIDHGNVVESGSVTDTFFQEEVLLCSTSAKRLYDNEITAEAAVTAGEPYRPLVANHYIANTTGVLRIGEEEDLLDGRDYILTSGSKALTIDNLKTGTTYYYKLTTQDEEHRGSFQTAPSTRFVNLPGVKNTRDIGGYVNQDGKTVKQGLLIRGTELDGLVQQTYFLATDSVQEVKDTFGFVYDFDLRAPDIYSGIYQSRLGADVGHSFYNAPQYGGIFNRANHPNLRRIFADLADAGKYPMYFHCTHGADRAGTMVFLLQGILNMSQEDMLREYCLTGYFRQDCALPTAMEVVVNGLQPYAGETLAEKAVTFLKQDVGVTQQEIDSIRAIFLED